MYQFAAAVLLRADVTRARLAAILYLSVSCIDIYVQWGTSLNHVRLEVQTVHFELTLSYPRWHDSNADRHSRSNLRVTAVQEEEEEEVWAACPDRRCKISQHDGLIGGPERSVRLCRAALIWAPTAYAGQI